MKRSIYCALADTYPVASATCRAIVDKEAWQAHSDKLRSQLEAAEATAAAQRQAAELWQRKHGLLEEQLKGMQVWCFSHFVPV